VPHAGLTAGEEPAASLPSRPGSFLVLAQLEHAKAFGPHSRIEAGDDDGPVLVLNKNYGCGGQFDPDQRISSSWRWALDQGTFTVRVRLGPFTRCQNYDEKSCKRSHGAIPIAPRESNWA
jgi:hypothetical protein